MILNRKTWLKLAILCIYIPATALAFATGPVSGTIMLIVGCWGLAACK